MTLLALALTLLLLALLAYVQRLRSQRDDLRHELRRVRRAGMGRTEAQQIELRWFHTLGELLPFPVFVTDDEKRLLYANAAATQQFGAIQSGEGAIQRLRDHRLEALLEEGLQSAEPRSRVAALRGHEFLVTVRAWSDGDGRVGGATMLMQDISELLRLSRARRDMAANLSHELRTPLASIKLMTEILLDSAPDDAAVREQFLRRIAIENEALIRLIEDLTALAWIESGRTPLRLETLNLRDFIEQRLQRLEIHRAAKGLHFEATTPPGAMATLDPERFGQVLTNLLDNAIKFSPVGATIRLTVEQQPDATYLAIADEGPGILPSELPRIFERFYKGDPARTRSREGGTGLGLAIAKHLVEAQGGTIAAANNPGRGATFTISLPAEQPLLSPLP